MTESALHINNLSVKIGESLIVREFTASASAGSHTIVIGPSGSGKTTLLRAVAGLLPPAEGRIALGERIWSDSTEKRFVPPRERRIGLVAQDLALWPGLTAERQLLRALRWRGVPRHNRGKEAARLLELAGLEGRARHRPDQLSGGEGQRLAMARALAGDSRLLLLDEPFGQLDVELRERLSREVHRMAAALSTSILHVTHDPRDVLGLASQVWAMDEGRLVRAGTPEELSREPQTAFIARALGYSNLLWPELAEALGATAPPRRLTDGRAALAAWELAIAPDGLPGEVIETTVSGGRWTLRVRCRETVLEVETLAPPAENEICLKARPLTDLTGEDTG